VTKLSGGLLSMAKSGRIRTVSATLKPVPLAVPPSQYIMVLSGLPGGGLMMTKIFGTLTCH
jgi:hypothetical protein